MVYEIGPNREFTIERDVVGTLPVYYAKFGLRHYVSHRLISLVRAYPGPITVNREYLQKVCWNFYADWNESPYLEIKRLPPGSKLEIANGRAKVIEGIPFEWEKPGSPSPERLRSTWREICAETLTENPKLGVLLSGGFDSTALMLQLEEVGTGRDLFSYSLTFQSAGQKSPTLEMVCRTGSWKKHFVSYEEQGPRAFMADTGPDLPLIYSPNLYFFLPLLRAAALQGVNTVCLGTGPEFTFSYPLQIYASFLKNGHLGRLVSDFRWLTFRNLLLPLVPAWAYSRMLRCRQWPRPLMKLDADEELKIKLSVNSYLDRLRRLPMEPHQRLIFARFFMSGLIQFGMEQEQELAQSFGIRMSYPYFHPMILRRFMELPLESVARDFDNKPLLREAFRGLVPEQVRTQTSAQDYTLVVEEIMRRQEPLWTQRIDWLVGRKIVNPVEMAKLSMDEIQKLNYVYSVAKHERGAHVEKEPIQEKTI